MGDRFDQSQLQAWQTQAHAPNAPAGQQQAAAAAAGYGSENPRFENSQLGRSTAERGYVDNARSWYTGANTEGTNNGWSSEYWNRAMAQNEELSKSGGLATQFERDDATGVVTWDHTSSDGRHTFKFGDVYDNGQKVGNVYDQFKDPGTADLMMADLLFDASTKRHIFTDSDVKGRLAAEVARQRDWNNENIPKQLTAKDFQESVEKRSDEFQEGGGEVAVTAAGALGGGTSGAAAGAVVAGPVGALVGGTGGALLGGLGAWMNRDELLDQAARAYEVTSMADKQHGLGSAILTGAQEWGGFAGRFMAPLSNTVHGATDQLSGHAGDGESQFYKVDAKGDSVVPKWVKIADVGATIGDSLVQFSSPLGLAIYSAQMGSVIAGEAGNLALTGSSFDDRRGQFDSVFTDDDGNFDLKSAAAGIGKVGIDVVQMGMVRGLAGKTNALRSQTGLSTTKITPGFVERATEKVTGRLPKWAGGQSDKAAAKAALEAGGKRVELGGFEYVVDAGGNAVSRRTTLSILAPSEQLPALSAGMKARRAAAQRGGALKADDFYRAAEALSTGEKRFTGVIVNAMGEAYEEGLQGILEPLSHEGRISGSDVFNSALYGFAAGAGMAGAFAMRQPSQDTRLFAQAQMAQLLRTGGIELSQSDWDKMTPTEKRALAAMSRTESEVAAASYQRIHDDQAAEQVAGTAGIAKLHDAMQSALAANLAKLTDRTDGAFVIAGLEDVSRVDAEGNLLPDSMPANAVGSSALQLAANLTQHHRGITIQLKHLKTQQTEANEALAANPEDADAARRVEELGRQIDKATLTLEWAQKFDREIDEHIERMYREGISLDEVLAETVVLNDKLRRAFNLEDGGFAGDALTADDKLARARAVSMLFARDPHDSAGSYQMLVPQASAQLTHTKSDNFLQISHAILDAIRGDYDGDKVRPLNQLVLDDEEFTSARSGSHFIGAGTKVNVGAPKFEKYIVEYMAEGLHSNNPALQSYAMQTMLQITNAIRNRYAGLGIDRELDLVFEAFFGAVESGSKDARATLLDGLAEHAGGPLNEFARSNLSNEWLWIDQLIVSTMNNFQEIYAANRSTRGAAPNTTKASPIPQAARVRERRMREAANLGATLAQQTAGDSLFRKFQKLHYTSIGAPVLDAEGNKVAPTSLREMALLYESLGQGLTQNELDNIRAKDLISGRVFLMLRRLAMDATQVDPSLNPYQALVVVANLSVADGEFNEDGEFVPNGHVVSLAQLLLKQSVRRDQKEKAAILADSDELQAKHNRLLAMTTPGGRGDSNPVNAERAFVEVVGSQQLFALLGDDANVFGPHLTVEQYLRTYTSMSEADRRQLDYRLKAEDAYLGREGRHNLPYDLREVAAGEVSAYRSVVDSIIAVGHHRISMSEDGTLTGELAERSDGVSENFQAAHTQVRAALREFAGLSGRRDGELNVDLVRRLVESNPDFARQLMNLIPNAAANAVLEVRDGQVYASNWLFEMFTIRDSAQAEMHYWRNLLLAQWNALGARNLLNEEDADTGHDARRYNRLPRRMQRVIYRLGKEPDNGVLLKRFIDELESATSVKSFLHWVNTTPGVRGEQAPLTAWVDDVSEFDPDKAQGGWTTAIAGAELREAISQLSLGTQRLVKDLSEERAALAADTGTLQAIRRVLRKDAGADVVLDPGDREVFEAFSKAIDNAGQLAVGLGPQAMLYQTVGAVLGFYPQAHTKGKNPPNVEPAGAFEAYRDAFGYVTNFERMMASLTAVNLDAVGANLGQVAKDGVRTMDDHGRVVVQAKPTPQQMLELLEGADTRPLARAILFPQVMERGIDGQLRPQMLVGKSLKSLLSGVSHKELIAAEGTMLSQDKAFRYLSLVEATAREFGGHFDVQRAVNDLVIARTSAARHTLSVDELERMSAQAYMDMAQALQAAAKVSVAPRSAGTDPFEKVRAGIKQTRKKQRLTRLLGLAGEEGELSDIVLDQMVEGRLADHLAERQELLDRVNGTNDEEIARRVANLDADHEAFKAKIEMLRTDDTVAMVSNMFTIPADPAEAVVKKDAIVRYISGHWQMLESASAVKETINKLSSQLMDPARHGQVDLTDKEWDELSRASISHYLDRAASLTAAGVSVPLFPDADHVSDQRYFDSTFSYLAEPLLDPNGPLLQAAQKLHERAGLQAEQLTDVEFAKVLDRTIYGEFSLGAWTSDIPRASIEANQRLDSSAAAAAIAMYGNSPKTQAVISAATRRTFKVPGLEMASTVTLKGRDLTRSLFDEVDVLHPAATEAAKMPLAQLTNRFASSVTLRSAGVEVDLLDFSNTLGRTWHGNEAAVAAPYKEISVERLKHAIDDWARVQGLDPNQLEVEVQFFHPDTMPAEPDWSNNLFFEGTSFKLDADRHESLNATLWFANESISPAGQAAALDASKLGKPALQVIDVADAETVAQIEAEFHRDLAAVLRAKTREILDKDLGAGALDPEFYNAVYKNLKLRHFVRTDGRLLSAEQVIEMQRRGEELPADAALWTPSDDVLRSMLGEQGTQGVTRIFDDQLEIDLAKVPTYRGVTDTMIDRFSAGIEGNQLGLADTRIAHRARQSQLVVRPMLTQAERVAYDTRMRFQQELRDEIVQQRSQMVRHDEGGFQPKRNLAAAVQIAQQMFDRENIAFDWSRIGIPFIGPRKPADTVLSKMLLHEVEAVLELDNTRAGWIYRANQGPDSINGILSDASLHDSRAGGMRVAPGDLVVVEVESFNGDERQAQKALDYFARHGATVVLGQGGRSDSRVELAQYLETLNYERLAGSSHIYRPIETSSRYQNQKARESSLTEMRGVSAKSRLAIFNTRGLGVQEGTAWVNSANERLGSIAVQMNLLPVDALGGFNVPVERFDGDNLIDKVKAQLRSLNTPEGLRFLRDMAGVPKGDKTFDEAFIRMLDRFDQNNGTVLPQPGDEFGTGDLIPLVDGRGKILLYRHGYKAPNRDVVDEHFTRGLPGKQDAAGISSYSAQPEPQATTHTGTVVSINPRSGFGLSVELNIPLQVFGDKKQLEWNGMKYVLSPTPPSVVLPDHPFFANGWGLDIVTDAATAFSKEAFDGLVDNHRNAFAFFGIDFLPDVTEFFFPGKGHDPDAQRQAREMLGMVVTRAPRIQLAAADELLNANRLLAAFTDTLPDLGSIGDVVGDWAARLQDRSSVPAQITAAMLVYLSTPGARVSDVLTSGGFNNDDSNSSERQSILMPRLFTQVFDNADLDSELRTEINRRFNEQLHNPNTDGTGYLLHKNFTFEIRNTDPGKNMEGFLQFAEAHSSGDNPIKNGMSFDETQRGAVSAHSAAIAYQAIGAETAYSRDLAMARNFAQPSPDMVRRFERDKIDGGVWRMLTDIPAEDASFQAWRAQTPAEAERRSLARDAVVQFRQPIKQEESNNWSAQNKKDYLEVSQTIVRKLNLKDSQVGIVDSWVRQMLGMPYGENTEGEELGRVTGPQAIEAAKEILANVTDRYLPTVGAEVPMLHVHDLQLIYAANEHAARPWLPREAIDPSSSVVKQWDDWVNVALGSALVNNDLFDPLYLLATDGFMHSYQNATRSLLDLPVSIDALVSRKLLDTDTNQLMVSIDQQTNLIATDPVMLNVQRASLADLLGGQRIAGKFKGKQAPASEIAKRREVRRKWRKEHDVPMPVDVTMRNFRENGAEFVDASTTTNALARSLINLRVGTALINPALYVSMGPEQWIRGTLDRAANLLTGQATSGALGTLAAKTGLSHFSPEQLTSLNQLYRVLGQRQDFKAMVYRDLMFQRPHAAGIGKIEKWLESYAKFGSRMQDPTWGMRGDTLARRYLEAVIQHLDATPTEAVLSTDRLIAELMTDPTFLKTNFPEAHQAGSNAIAQLRSLKPTPLSLALRGIYEPLSESPNSAVNFLGNVVLKVPLLFSGYAMNVATTITGLQGLSDITAMFLHGRTNAVKHPVTLIQRIQAKMRGEEIPVDADKDFDMSSVMEGIDLSRAFIRGGLTHTGLFAFGLMAGGLGLSGEDDETKRRRRAAELQGAGFVYDPRRIENDFRNADSIFLDWMPFGMDHWFRVTGEDAPGGARSMGQLHWMMKQFVSPIIGMERFFETGDFRQVGWGYQDALGAFPLINTMMWNDTVETAHELARMANDQAKLGGPENLIASANLLTTAVGTYERMLFENSFVNMVYSSWDKYDRDPFAQPLMNADGTQRTDALGNPEDSTVLKPYIGTDGQILEGYAKRDSASALLHGFTENRFTAAAVLSLFTGLGESDYWRRNMVIKTRSMEKAPIEQGDAEALIRAALMGEAAQGAGMPNLSADELAQLWKQQAKDAGIYVDWSQIDAQAAEAAKHGAYGTGQPAPLTMLDKDGREHLTHLGARGVFDGLVKGMVKLDDASLAGIYITKEMRDEIQKDWMAELIQEGVDMGLDQTKATSRMKRLWYGPTSDPSVKGIGDILWSKDISYSDKVEYNQLNTTYITGPDGRPWATGFTRDGVLGAFGLKPLKRAYVSKTMDDGSSAATGVDQRLNTTDLVNGMNTGLRALELKPDAHIPTDEEIAKRITDAIEKAAQESYTPYASSTGGGGGYSRGRRGYGHRGRGGSYGGGGGYADFQKMYSLPSVKAPYGDSIPFINMSNPIIRRADVRRERVWSERGRLNQWQ